MALGLIKLNNTYFPDPTKGRPVFNGSVFIGKPGLNPEVEANRVDVYLRQAGNSDVLILPSAQPLTTGAGGLVLYNGDTAEVLVDGNYSLKVLNNAGSQVYYTENALGDPAGSFYPLTAGSSTAYTANTGIGAYILDEVSVVQIHVTNTTGNPTMAYDGLPAVPIVNLFGNTPGAGSMLQGMLAQFRYDGANLVFQAADLVGAATSSYPKTSGTSIAYTAALGVSAYTVDANYKAQIHTANTGSLTVSATMSFDGLAVLDIVLINGSKIAPGHLPQNHIAELQYDGTNLILLNPANTSISFNVYSGSFITLPGVTTTPITFDNKVYDVNDDIDVVTNVGRFTPKIKGKYLLTVAVQFSSVTAGVNCFLQINKKGLSHQSFVLNTSSAFNHGINSSAIVDADGVTDYFDASIQIGTATGMVANPGSGATFMTGTLLGI
ncbi:MAG: hypothetical protein BMS9Abin31_0154 [Gammaproteobacteria bacterium]|nr:MAG: hypothetical protein BMS9Abin31_0154 [Gammaproteobacteria bacterium]